MTAPHRSTLMTGGGIGLRATPRAAGSVGLLGTILAVCGCLGFPVVLALLSALGARWLLQPQFLLPMLAAGVALGLWSLLDDFRRTGDPLPLVLALVGGAAALVTEIVRALTHQHAYFLGYPGLALFVAAFVTTLVRRDRPAGHPAAR